MNVLSYHPTKPARRYARWAVRLIPIGLLAAAGFHYKSSLEEIRTNATIVLAQRRCLNFAPSGNVIYDATQEEPKGHPGIGRQIRLYDTSISFCRANPACWLDFEKVLGSPLDDANHYFPSEPNSPVIFFHRELSRQGVPYLVWVRMGRYLRPPLPCSTMPQMRNGWSRSGIVSPTS